MALSLVVDGKGTNWISVYISGIVDPCLANQYAWYRNGQWVSQTNQCVNYYTFTGLQPNTSYYLEGKLYALGEWGTPIGTTVSTDKVKLGTPSFLYSLSPPTTIEVHYNSVSYANGYSFFLDVKTPVDIFDTPWSGSSSTPVYTFSGLTPGRTYYVICQAFDRNGVYDNSNFSSATAIATQSLPATPSEPLIETHLDGGYRVKWSASINASSYELQYWNYTGVINTVNTSNTYAILNGLGYGISYQLRVRGVNAGGSSNWSAESTGTTLPKTPSISLVGVDNTSITISTSTISGNYTGIQVDRLNASSVYLDSKYCLPGNSVTWAGLPMGTRYIFQARSYFNINGTTLYSLYNSNTLEVATNSRPANFQWDNTKVSGNNFNVTATEWTRLQNKVNEFRQYKNEAIFDFYSYNHGDWSFANAVSGQNFYYYHFNQVRNGISTMNSSGLPGTKVSGDLIYASDLNALVACLNAV